MNILVVGNIDLFEELKIKLGEEHKYSSIESSESLNEHKPEVIFDFMIEEEPESLENYEETNCPVFISAVKICLAELNVYYPLRGNWFGFNGLPTFINRKEMEVSVHDSSGKSELKRFMNKLNTGYVIVDDRVGMVTPRVICMIINEAFYTLGEGTATSEDIDMAMKLGTNYPLGPFEWADRIGIQNVYEILEAVYEDTGDERYKISPALKKRYLKELAS